jgi:glutamine amidotransferase
MKKCLILDYGVGNVASIRTFFRDNEYMVSLGKEFHEIRNADLLILPGVGSFNSAFENVKSNGIAVEIQNRHSAQMPILGICLGFQLLTNKSEESPTSSGFRIFNGETKRLKEFSRIGWGKIDFKSDEDLMSNDYFFFNHSYGVYDVLDSEISAFAGQSRYQALAIKDKTVGVQFHPERSQKSGKKFLNWLEDEVWNLGD